MKQPQEGVPELARRVIELFPQGVAAFEVHGAISHQKLIIEEFGSTSRAAEKRVNEFATGRLCARLALSALGLPETTLLRARSGEVTWPQGVTGSISHTDGYCVAVVGHTLQFYGLGIDAERVGQLQDSLWRLIFRPTEIEFLESLPERERPTSATAMFTAKEAFYKCQYPLTSGWLDFQDVLIELARDSFHVTLCKREHCPPPAIWSSDGRFMLDKDLIVSGIAIPIVR